jgi:subtilisin family serine protease
MRRALVMMTVVLTALAVAGGASADVGGVRPDRPRPAGAVIDAVVERRLTTAGASDLLDVVVVMRARADLSSVVTKKRQKRLATVEHELRTIAATAQEGVLSFLARQEQRGLATAIEPLWIVNGIDVKATPDVIRQLAARPDVQEIQPNISIHAPWATATTSSAPAEPNVGVVNAPAMWALGYRGQGIVVANMDTGVDVSHPELASRWRAEPTAGTTRTASIRPRPPM